MKAGIQRVCLSDYGVKLIPGERYNWSIALVLDPKRRSKDIIAMGAIERVERADINPAAAPTTDAFYRFAADGLWYDAVMTISELIESTPDDLALRKRGPNCWIRSTYLRSEALTSLFRMERPGETGTGITQGAGMITLGRGIFPYVTDDSVNYQGLFFSFDANLSDPIEHEAIPKIALRAFVDQDPAQSPTRRLLNDIPIQTF